MIWLSWRQHRTQLVVAGLVFGLLAIYLLITGMDIHSRFHSSGLESCLGHNHTTCGELSSGFLKQYLPLAYTLLVLMGVLPLLAGMFFGAPLVSREMEQSLHRLAWMQSVSRTRWLTVKVAMLGIPMMAGIALLAWALSWWIAPLAAADAATGGVSAPIAADALNSFAFPSFDLSGIVPVAYVLFAVAAGVAAGTVLGRTVAAMGATMVAFIVVRLAIEELARPWYLPVRMLSYAFASSPGGASPVPTELTGSYVVYAHVLDNAGRVVFDNASGVTLPNAVLAQDCPGVSGLNGGGQPVDNQALQGCLQHAGLHVVAAYHPANEFWTFQGIEAGIFALLALALLALSVWWVRRRIA
jgi:hypothetical protein